MTKFKLALFTTVCAALTIAAVPKPAQAAIEYPWCAQYNGEENGGRNCGFVSYDQCMMTARGAGASCEPNLFYLDQAKQKQQPRQRHINN
jgi:hypothetical protein